MAELPGADAQFDPRKKPADYGTVGGVKESDPEYVDYALRHPPSSDAGTIGGVKEGDVDYVDSGVRQGEQTTDTGGGGTDTGGGEAAASTDSGTGDSIRFTGLPGSPEIWQSSDTGMVYVVFFVPGMEPELPMLWEVPNPDDLQSFFGDDAIVYDRIGTDDEMSQAGMLNFGTVDEIVLRGENPYSGWESQFERESKVQPYLNDPEVAAIIASAWMEGRAPTEGELASAEWFYSKTAGEQEWYTLLASQPETAKQLLASNALTVRRGLEQAGVYDPPDEMVDYINDKWTVGLWTDEMVQLQSGLLADPQKAGDRDIGLMDVMNGVTYDTTANQQLFVEEEVRRWLGPAFGQWTDDQVNNWASRLRNDPDGQDALQRELSRQRLAAYSEYEDPFLTYEDIATPWRNLAFNAWGQNVDESSAFFTDIVKANDAGYASAQLRQEGLNQGVKQVEDSFLSDITRSFSRGSRGYGT